MIIGQRGGRAGSGGEEGQLPHGNEEDDDEEDDDEEDDDEEDDDGEDAGIEERHSSHVDGE